MLLVTNYLWYYSKIDQTVAALAKLKTAETQLQNPFYLPAGFRCVVWTYFFTLRRLCSRLFLFTWCYSLQKTWQNAQKSEMRSDRNLDKCALPLVLVPGKHTSLSSAIPETSLCCLCMKLIFKPRNLFGGKRQYFFEWWWVLVGKTDFSSTTQALRV